VHLQNGRVSYLKQHYDPWFFAGGARQRVLFRQEATDVEVPVMTRGKTSLVAVAVAGLCAGWVTWLHAGNLNPPPGPVAGTMKPLDQVEPRTAVDATNTPGDADSPLRITQPGSYSLTGNVTGASGKSGIEIAAGDVTLDLSGFCLTGVAGSLAGISVSGTQSNVAIRNGAVRSREGGGIMAGTCVGCIIEDVRSLSNTGHGMLVGPDAMICRCYCVSNTQSGIFASTPSLVSDCLSRANGQTGITAGDHSSFLNCVAKSNASSGLSLGAGSLVRGCISAQNTGVGVTASSGLDACDSIARNNGGHGFFCFGASFENCLSTVNTGDGFNTDSAMIANCRSTGNHGNGYLVGSHSLVVHSIAVSNDFFGVHGDSGYVLRNLAAQNSLNQSELREIKLDSRGRADGNHLSSFNSLEWGLGGTSSTLFIMNSLNGGFVPTFGGTKGPDINDSNIGTECSPSGNYAMP
jgi:hypothetical protein